ncbi:AAA family ATPase [Bacillus subtilis]|nr:AAA family ATPase [Bacillus subtilis]
MRISQVKLQGFRNFKSATINFNDKTLIIGQNDIGKSNLIHALRLLLDKSLSENDLEPKDSDFYAHEEVTKIVVQIKFSDVTEDCIRSKFKGNISSENELILQYEADKETKNYILKQGKDEESLEEFEGRYYLRVINLLYVSTKRDLRNYIKKEKLNLIKESKASRKLSEEESDEKNLKEINSNLEFTNEQIRNLHFVKNATSSINNELGKLSTHHESNKLVFNVGPVSSDDFINSLELFSEVNGKGLKVGGDGRNNQIFLSLWAQANSKSIDSPTTRVTLYCIEEPEIHLHPQQQRKLAEYLINNLDSQVIITSHSPQIACEFKPNSIVRLYNNTPDTKAANNGCSTRFAEVVDDFAYRLNIIPAEAYFAKAVLLVEGPSELLFYKSLAKELDLDLDKHNISILMVDGVGFDVYMAIFKELNIPCVVRTDNDISKVPRKSYYQCAGVRRCIKLYRSFFNKLPSIEDLLERESELVEMPSISLSPEISKLVNDFKKEFEAIGIFISKVDLETDLADSPLFEILSEYFKNTDDKEEIINKMQNRKALFMYSFLKETSTSLNCLDGDSLAKPLQKCIELAGE